MTPTTPVRLQRSRQHKNVSPNGLPVVSCSRPGKFGNPHPTAGDFRKAYDFAVWVNCHNPSFPVPLEQAKALNHMKRLVNGAGTLIGNNLSCWCKLCPRHAATGKPLDERCPDCAPCHVDVIAERIYALPQ